VVVSGLMALGVTALTAPAAWAAPPGNDARVDAIALDPPQTVTGTLVEATATDTNDFSNCAGTDGSVWYRFTGPARGEAVLQLDAAGDMDATVDLFKQVRSTFTPVDCRPTDDQGLATLDEDSLTPGARYVVRVGNQSGSIADTFKLRVLIPTAPPQPPGRHLPRRGTRDRVDRVLNPGDAYWTRMRAGRTMRVSLRTRQCTSLEVFGPGTQNFSSATPDKRLPCGGFAIYTPRTTGRHFFVVRAARDRDIHRYGLRVARARRDDTAPGVLIHNHAKVTGRVNGGIDTRDLYRFDVTRLSALTLRLSGSPGIRLLRDDGSVVGVGDLVDRHVRAGRYVVAVSGSGRYTLRLGLRTITRSRLLVNGRQFATIRPGSSAKLWLRVAPAVAGPSRITVERFDPIDGWQFLRHFRPHVIQGSARVPFQPPGIGRYRARADYLGTREAAPSSTGPVRLLVQRPLGE
jgi:hypothetical protein